MTVLTDCAIFFYLQESFARAKNWVKELQRQASPNIVIALSGNKADLASKRAVDFQVRANKLRLGNKSCFFGFLGNSHLLHLIDIAVVLFYLIKSRSYIKSDYSISLCSQDFQSQFQVWLSRLAPECVRMDMWARIEISRSFMCVDRMPSPTQTTTAYFSWRRRPRHLWMWMRYLWLLVGTFLTLYSMSLPVHL